MFLIRLNTRTVLEYIFRSTRARRRNIFREEPARKAASSSAGRPSFSRAGRAQHARTMGKRKTKRRSNSALGVTSYFKRFQVKFARRRAGACDAPVISTAKP